MQRSTNSETFSSKLGLLLAALGMAVGTGNIWRFPRILANNGGGAFIIAWLIFLFAWSIPLIVAEFGLGRGSRKGCVGAAAFFGGKNFAFLGAFIAFCTSAIMCYYAVVAGWCIKYLFDALLNEQQILHGSAAQQHFISFANSPLPMLFQALALGAAAIVVAQGVVGGIERANKFIIPALFLLLIGATIRSLTLRNASAGLTFIFSIHPEQFADVNLWLEALTQSAWSTGAGWGLILTYGVYVKKSEKIVSTSIITGIGNNIASIIAAVAIIPAVFALAPLSIPSQELLEIGGVAGLLKQGGPASTGLTFVWMPALFAKMPGGSIFAPLFFIALFFAALSSLIAMVELAVRTLMDMGINRKKGVIVISVAVFIVGIPSATNLTFFQNQDWVWALGLMLSGLFISILVSIYGATNFRKTHFHHSEFHLWGRFFDFWIRFGIPLLFVVVIGWWFKQSFEWNSEQFLNPLEPFSVGTVLLQWAIVLIFFALLNKYLVKKNL
ncbi:MAG: sodium-dependent transporter [Deltaproteobacteria bacterium]|nr:sodium-dependent transporter [Deltaproteobacteria bacterium]MBN2672393.1 sodium-dependent transporter [Deltaproteobacteria bacterium]